MNSTRQPLQEACQRKTILRWNGFSPANPSQNKGKLGYIKLIIPTACPPRTVVPVNQGCGFASLFHLSTPGSLLVRNATVPTMLTVLKHEPLGRGKPTLRFYAFLCAGEYYCDVPM
jgi:hypothetical protein